MIIIEGADAVGKTTLAKRICQELDLRYAHYGLLPKTWDYLTDYVPSIADRVVLDRFMLSELVYSRVLNREHKLESATYRQLMSLARWRFAAQQVVVTADERVIRARYDSAREAFPIDRVLEANAIFTELVSDPKALIDVHVHVTRVDGLGESAISALIGHLNEARQVYRDVRHRVKTRYEGPGVH